MRRRQWLSRSNSETVATKPGSDHKSAVARTLTDVSKATTELIAVRDRQAVSARSIARVLDQQSTAFVCMYTPGRPLGLSISVVLGVGFFIPAEGRVCQLKIAAVG